MAVLSDGPSGGGRNPYVFPVTRIGGELQEIQAATLQAFRKKNSFHTEVRPSEDHADVHSHKIHHVEKNPSIFTAVPSAIINFLLMFGLCCAYGMIMFEDSWNARHRGLAVKMNLGSALIVGLLLATRSKIKVAIGGPDLNPVVFLGMFVTTIAEDIAKQQHLAYPSAEHRRLTDMCSDIWEAMDLPGGSSRSLGSSSSASTEFCMGAHYQQHSLECDTYHAQLRATAVFTVSVSSLTFGMIYLSLGRMRLTRYVSYVPTNIMEAFLSCVGYKVFKYALKFCKFDLKQFLPAACVGVTLYVLKASHFGNPAIVIPLMLLVPLGIFYAIVYGSGSSLSELDSYMFPEMDDVEFWKIWTDSIGSASDINFKAWLKTLPDMPIMIVVVVLDCLLKLSSTENKLPVKPDKDYEMQLYGAGNILTSLCGSSVGYMQLKFNVINFGVLGNAHDRRGGAIYALMCGACFFYSIRLFNYLPRFFLGTLLFFAGAGFVAENLWGSRKYLSRLEWMQVVAVLAVFIMLNSLLYAVIVGALLVGVGFIAKYANISCIAGPPLHGASIFSTERRQLLAEKSMQHLADRWILLIRLKGYIFFASAQTLFGYVSKTIEFEADTEISAYQRLRFVVFDCKLLDGMDSSAAKALSRLVAIAHSREVRILWTNVDKEWAEEMKPRGLVATDEDWFSSTEVAINLIHMLIRRTLKQIEERWLRLHPTFSLIDRLTAARRAFGPLSDILTTDAARFGCPWQYCGRIQIQRSKTLLWRPGDTDVDLFLVSSGRVGLFTEIPGEGDGVDWSPPIAVYGYGWFLNRDAVHGQHARHYAVALEDGELIFWNEHQRSWMTRERPEMAAAITTAVLRQEAADSDHLCAALNNHRLSETSLVPDAPSRRRAVFAHMSVGTKMIDETSKFQISSVPEELEREVRGISIAKALDSLGLYCPIESREKSILPGLPPRISEDLHIAFHTYCTLGTGQDGARGSHVPAAKVSDALMYAGILNTMLTSKSYRSLTKAEFLDLGHVAAMTPLNNMQVGRLKEIFNERDMLNHGRVGCESLLQLFKENISSTTTVADVDGVASLWYKDGSHDVTFSDFLGIMSRFIKIHEPDWLLFCGLRHLGINDCDSDLQQVVLTPEMLMSQNKAELDLTHAKEMIWTADISGGKGDGKTLDCRLVVAALFSSEIPGSTLPPPPRMVQPEVETAEAAPGKLPEAFGDGDSFTLDAVDDMGNIPAGNGNVSFAVDGDAGKEPPNVDVDGFLCDEEEDVGVEDDVRSIVVDPRTVSDPDVLAAMSAKTHRKTVQILRKFSSTNQGQEQEEEESGSDAPDGWRAQLYLLLEEPTSSKAARIVSLAMGFLILLSCLMLVSEPLISPEPNKYRSKEENLIWFTLECFFTVIFTLEILLRLLVADALGTSTQCMFLRQPMTICDIAAVMPFFVEVVVDTDEAEYRLLRIIRLLRLSRVMRLGRLAKNSQMFSSVAVILTVIWGIYLKTDLNSP